MEVKRDADLLANIILGHLMTYLGTPSSLTTWKTSEISLRIQLTLFIVGLRHRNIPPSAAVHAMLVIRRHKELNPHIVAWHDEAEILHTIAFMAILPAYDPLFMPKTVLTESYIRTKLWGSRRNHLNTEIELELAHPQIDLSKALARRVLQFYTAPLLEEVQMMDVTYNIPKVEDCKDLAMEPPLTGMPLFQTTDFLSNSPLVQQGVVFLDTLGSSSSLSQALAGLMLVKCSLVDLASNDSRGAIGEGCRPLASGSSGLEKEGYKACNPRD